MRRAAHALGTALCLLCLLAAILCLTAAHMGRDAALYARCFHAFADTSRFGVPESAYDGIAEDIAAYLSGAEADLSLFNAREQAHLSDIRALFRLFDRAWLLLIPAAALAVILAARHDSRGYWAGLALTFLLLAGLAAWIALDFVNAFIALHRLLFTNDLWLLDPQTDLLICLMPERMFTFLAGRLALYALPVWLIAPTCGAVCDLLRRGGKERWKQ